MNDSVVPGKYDLRGVSADKTDVHNAIKNLDKGIFPGAFCKLIPDYISGSNEHALAIHADGAGTKSSLAYLYWRETGDISVWRGIAQDAIVMNTDDLLCAGITDNFIFSSTIGRNKRLIPGEVIKEIIEGSEAFFDMLNDHGISIKSGGGETADLGDLVRTVVVDSTVTARVAKANVIDNHNIQPGDVVIGLASYGQTKYEDSYNAGMGSNGLTSARHDLLHHDYAHQYPESFDNGTPDELVYSGPYHLTDKPVENLPDIGRMILSPTRTYLPFAQALFKNYRSQIHGLIHCSGGGQSKVLHFIKSRPNGMIKVVKDNLPDAPPLFTLIQNASGAANTEMYKVFNMGVRLEVYAPEILANEIIRLAGSYNIDAWVTGKVEPSNKPVVAINKSEQSWVYE